MPAQLSSSTFLVEVDGSEIPEAVQLALLDATIEDELNLPDSCELVFRDALRSVLSEGGFELGKQLTVKVMSESSPSGTLIFEGEITALEAELERDGTLTVVRGLDPLHRLQRGTHTETYLDSTYGDIAGKVAKRNGLEIGDVGSNNVVNEAVMQWNQTDWEFLTELAALIGHEVVVTDGKLTLREPGIASDGPDAGEIDSDDPRRLVMGSNVLQLRTTISGGEQVGEVVQRGWDFKKKEPVESIVAAAAAVDSAQAGLGAAQVAETFGGRRLVLASRAVRSAEVADDEATSVAQQLGSSLAELDGVLFGSPELRAGTSVSLAGVGEPFDGKYVLTSCRHTYSPGVGYRTAIRVSGRQTRTLLGVIGGSKASRLAGRAQFGVLPAMVTDIDDKENLGRVKVKFPWLDDNVATHWARVAMPGAGPERGLCVLPEKDDEVLVAFEQGDIQQPFVLGGLYNGRDKMPLEPIDSGKVVSRALVSRLGHRLELHDADKQVTLVTADGKHRIVLDEAGGQITIESTGPVEISSQKSMGLSAPDGLTLESTGAIELKGQGVTIDAGSGAFEARGTNATVEASTQATLKGGSTTTVSAPMIKIN